MPVAGESRRPLYNNLREIRQSAGVSRAVLADRLGINIQTIGALERGRYSPSLYLALVIADGLDVPLDALFGLQDVQEDGLQDVREDVREDEERDD